MTRTLLLFALLLLLPLPALAQCDSPESHQLDFWAGEWNLTWDGGSGTNRIEHVLDGCGILENFEGTMKDGTVFKGKSLSVYDPKRGTWRQTWIDNQSEYLAFEGGLDEDGVMVLNHERTEDGKKVRTRMLWKDVEEDSFTWVYERMNDEGEWAPAWTIHYERKD